MQVEEFFKESVSRLRDRNLAEYDCSPPTHTFSPEFEKSMRAAIAQKRRGELRVYTGRVWRQAACFTLAALVSLGACFVGVGAWSKGFLRMVEKKYPDHTDIHFETTGNGSPQTSSVKYTLTDVPPGFRRVGHDDSPDGFLNSVWYMDDDGRRILFDQHFAENIGIGLDTEGAELETLEFRGHPARFLENDGMCDLMWYDDRYVYMITTDLSREETMALGEKVQLKSEPYPTLQPIPIESLPESYPPEMAAENGDVVFVQDAIHNLEKLDRFVADSNAGKDGAVRLVRYAPDGSALIDDLQMENGRIYYTYDQHRWEDSEHPWTVGEEYDSVGLAVNGATNVLLAYSRHNDAPTEILRFER